MRIIALLSILILSSPDCMAGKRVDNSAARFLYPFGWADMRRNIPEEPPEGIQQVYLHAVNSNGHPMAIHAWFHFSEVKSNRTIVFFHGNNENLQMLIKRGVYERFKTLGYNFITIDYPGLGNSSSFPNEHNMREAGLATFEYALRKFPNTEMILWGRSMGAAVASQVAPLVQKHLKALLLTSPWASVPELASSKSFLSKWLLSRWISDSWFKEHTYDSVASARKMYVPSLVQHGVKDKVIPFEFGEQVFNAFPEGVAEFQSYPDLGHRKIFRSDKMWQGATEFLNSI